MTLIFEYFAELLVVYNDNNLCVAKPRELHGLFKQVSLSFRLDIAPSNVVLDGLQIRGIWTVLTWCLHCILAMN